MRTGRQTEVCFIKGRKGCREQDYQSFCSYEQSCEEEYSEARPKTDVISVLLARAQNCQSESYPTVHCSQGKRKLALCLFVIFPLIPRQHIQSKVKEYANLIQQKVTTCSKQVRLFEYWLDLTRMYTSSDIFK